MAALPLPRTADELSPEWLQGALSERHPGIAVEAVELVETRDGTNSHARLALSCTAPASGPPPPRALFAKLPPREARQRALVLGSGMGVREVLFYRHLSDHVPMRVPTCHYAAHEAESGAFVLLIEDLGDAGNAFPAPEGAVSLAAAEGAMDDFAALHATGAEPSIETGFVEPPLRQPEYGVGMLRHGLARHPERMSPAFAEIARIYCDHTHAVHDLWEAGPAVVNHGDGHLANLFFDAGRVGFLDWGCLSRAPALRDVGYFLCMSLSIADRRAHEQALIRRYLARAAERGLDVPSFEEAWLAHRRQAAYTVPAACPTVLSPDDGSPNARYAARFLARANAAVEDLDAATLLRSELGL